MALTPIRHVPRSPAPRTSRWRTRRRHLEHHPGGRHPHQRRRASCRT